MPVAAQIIGLMHSCTTSWT